MVPAFFPRHSACVPMASCTALRLDIVEAFDVSGDRHEMFDRCKLHDLQEAMDFWLQSGTVCQSQECLTRFVRDILACIVHERAEQRSDLLEIQKRLRLTENHRALHDAQLLEVTHCQVLLAGDHRELETSVPLDS